VAAVGYLSAQFSRHIEQAGMAEAKAEAIAEAGKALLELPKIWLRPQDEVVERVVRVSGWDIVEAAWQRGEGILFLTPHLGCFEITAQYYAAHAPITVLYRPPKQAWLQPLIESGRGGANLHLAPADLAGVRRMLKALKRREAVGMLPDQVPGTGEGVWADFFGRPAYTMTLAARLTEASRATVIMAYAERLPGGAGFHLHLMAPETPIEGPLEARAGAINRALEALIRRCPDQYLWGYNRYKAPRGGDLHAAEESRLRGGDEWRPQSLRQLRHGLAPGRYAQGAQGDEGRPLFPLLAGHGLRPEGIGFRAFLRRADGHHHRAGPAGETDRGDGDPARYAHGVPRLANSLRRERGRALGGIPGGRRDGGRAAPECLHRARGIEVAGAVLLAAQALQDASGWGTRGLLTPIPESRRRRHGVSSLDAYSFYQNAWPRQ
jgi:KDO2-lipid IV(A) lauroyltransferase